MRFLADESCDHALVRALRQAGYDVVAIAEQAAQSEDATVIRQAIREGRVLLTEDKDFGQLFFASGKSSQGVVLLRYPAQARERLVQDTVCLVERHGGKLKGCFVVVQPGRIRIHRVQ